MSKNHIIWSNYDLNLDDWIDDIKAVFDEQGFDYSDWTESKFHEVFTDKMYEANNEYFHDEQENLNIPTEGRIIAIVDLGYRFQYHGSHQQALENSEKCKTT
jgi:hypothetical protein